MGNETKINPFARILNAVTKVNPNLASQKEETASQTVVNSELAQAHEIEAQVQEQLLLGKYSVVKPLDVVSGEADLYLCNYQEKSYVAKIYRRDVAIKSEVMQALKEAQCEDIIAKLPDGIDTVIGSSGTYVSGGEVQRLSIARAMLKNAPILILDEATAFADPDNEAKVQEAFSRLSKGKTVIMIAHRLSSIVDADRICVLKDGSITEEGTHETLLQENGVYAHMWEEYNKSVQWKVGA